MMEIITLKYIIGSIFCLVVVYFMLIIPPAERRKYNKYDEFERINYISIKHSIFKPRYLMFNLDHHNEGSWYYKWISPGSAKIPRITNAPTLFLKQTIASIKATEEKKIYTEWLINQLSEKAEKNSARKAYYKKLEKLVYEIYDNLGHSDVSTGEELKNIIDDGYPDTLSRSNFWEEKNTSNWNEGTKELNLFGKSLQKRSREISEFYDHKILSEAKSLLEENQKGKCLTKSGNASSFFYNTIHRRLSDVEKENGSIIERPSEGTVKNKVNSLLKENGDIQKLISNG